MIYTKDFASIGIGGGKISSCAFVHSLDDANLLYRRDDVYLQTIPMNPCCFTQEMVKLLL